MIDDLKHALGELGLAPKETEVYLAMLELGPASVQDIGKRAGVNRSTTYVMLEGLKKHGLISTFEKGKKILFTGEAPERLQQIIADQYRKIRQKDHVLEQALPQLMAIYKTSKEKPRVRFFDGINALHEIRHEFAESSRGGEECDEIFSVDEHLIETIKITAEDRRKTVYKGKGRTIACIKPGFKMPYVQAPNTQRRVLDYGKFPFIGDMGIKGSQAYLISAKAATSGIIIEHEEIVQFLHVLFDIAWSVAKPWEEPEDWGPENYLPKD
ncbi:hypothetical protein COX00_01355 [Candidatus Uhrbacteria bacterium CG22_combo_CG10-13_8_21_14_all_47_17]|uniref:Transcription regulator TrmB N-terminal domain-containing protein n=1 Tax=Candidatus Uhrbacteria bacterium CG22_combo_CG10-13_8_21_14_all_47_17 TaxID=1975041 RepID=A0A2H0BUQ3_9BACT|nr:MAG: hypothetical protein COX00_01355 [Candidatus Uhrbacteria bacterium CG22_combo_CG10-13_8_21_14_all_47_17]